MTMRWRTMKYAPRDGRLLIIWPVEPRNAKDYAEPYLGYWDDAKRGGWYCLKGFYCKPTRWMPWPKPTQNMIEGHTDE